MYQPIQCLACLKRTYGDLYFRSAICPYCRTQLNFGRGVCYDCKGNLEEQHLDEEHTSVSLVE